MASTGSVASFEIEAQGQQDGNRSSGAAWPRVLLGIGAAAAVATYAVGPSHGRVHAEDVSFAAKGGPPMQTRGQPLLGGSNGKGHQPLLGAKQDAHGCRPSTGHSWCPSTSKCARGWADSCPGGVEHCQTHCKAVFKGEKEQDQQIGCKCSDDLALDYAPLKSMLGAKKDENGCLPAAGHSWCESTSKCIQSWIDQCPGIDPVPVKEKLGMFGGEKDAHGCMSSAGHSWCASSKKCIQKWEEDCPEEKTVMRGAKKDVHGCMRSTGHNWCPSTGKCVRGWAESCPGGTEHCQEHCKAISKGLLTSALQSQSKVACKCGDDLALDYTPLKPMLGGKKDENGCLPSAGHSWCESTGKCIQSWFEDCP